MQTKLNLEATLKLVFFSCPAKYVICDLDLFY